MDKQLSALERGVKLIGIGKHGSKKLPQELVSQILHELKNTKPEPILVGAFIGALVMKDIEPEYLILEEYLGKGALSNPEKIWDKLCCDTPVELTAIGIKLLSKQTLTVNEAEQLGDFLFDSRSGEGFRGMAVSILRIRYESDDEYAGIYNALKKIEQPTAFDFSNRTVIQLAEPFDGAEHSYMITPLLANAFEKQGYGVVVACAPNSGPKYGINTFDLYERMNGVGQMLNQNIYYPALEQWVKRRQIIMKRPFLATLEKVLNPVKAHILITSVFHIPYLEKMVELGIMAGFEVVIVLKRGLEGSLAPSRAKATGILCAVKQFDGSILYHTINGSDEEFVPYKAEADEEVEQLSLDDNIRLINGFLAHQQTGNKDFDARVKFAIHLYAKGLRWIEENRVKK